MVLDSGIPDNWGQAAVLYAMVEGLAGIVDNGALFKSVTISPRWMAAGKDEANVTVAYGASGNYVDYKYEHDPNSRLIGLHLKGDPEHYSIRVMLPDTAIFETATVNGQPVLGHVEKIRNSSYVIIELTGKQRSPEIVVRYGLD